VVRYSIFLAFESEGIMKIRYNVRFLFGLLVSLSAAIVVLFYSSRNTATFSQSQKPLILKSHQAVYGEWVSTGLDYSTSSQFKVTFGDSASGLLAETGVDSQNKLKFRIPAPEKMNHQFDDHRLWGGIYKVSVGVRSRSGSSSYESRMVIYSNDVSSDESVKEALIVSICNTSAQQKSWSAREVRSWLPADVQVASQIQPVSTVGKGACGCSMFNVILPDQSARGNHGLGEIIEAVRLSERTKHDLADRASMTVDPQVTRFLAPHGIYAFGRHSNANPDNPSIGTSKIQNLLPNATGKSSVRSAVLAVLDSGVTPIPALQRSMAGQVELSQSFLSEDGKPVTEGHPRDRIPSTRASEFDDHGHLLPSGGHGTPIAWLAAQGMVKGKTLFVRSEPVCDKNGHCPETKIIQGLCDALAFKDAKEHKLKTKVPLVINMSLFSPTPTLILRNVLNTVIQNSPGGVLIAAAAGNVTEAARATLLAHPDLVGIQGMYPAGYASTALVVPHDSARTREVDIPETWKSLSSPLSQVFGVGSLFCQTPDEMACKPNSLMMAESSISGSHVSFAVTGQWLESYDSAGHLGSYSGTSFATALTSGAFVRLMMGTDLTADQVDTCLRNPSNPAYTALAGSALPSILVGHGWLNFRKLPVLCRP
jgi:hypothetical protein